MKNILMLIGCIVTAFALTQAVGVNAKSSGIVWQGMSDAAFTEAASQKKLVLIFAKSDACHWCKQMESVTLANPGVAKLINKNYIPVKLDVDKNRDTAIYYQITSLPTVVILDASKNIVQVISGYTEPDVMLTNLSQNAK